MKESKGELSFSRCLQLWTGRQNKNLLLIWFTVNMQREETLDERSNVDLELYRDNM